ncbi:FAD-dependent oxidoreductase [Ruania rhizosphaerae]|uniref:FAD-dependent oxidoreductase n=1 Tax=Ruania rhizosphaerae TaxID=1840413 RepID=UPI001359F729|nr:FAD-dependent oxidoreductase [Ruania rhizosphaerae]
MNQIHADIAVIGAGLGGVAAALAAARHGRTVILTEETDWVGGQVTSQGVPVDEHRWIEQFGCTASYRAFRDGVRNYYRDHYPLTAAARADRYLNPGSGLVSRLCAEPGVAVAVLEAMLSPHQAAGRIDLRLRHRPIAAATDGDTVTSVTVENSDGGHVTISADYILDATETGELLPLTGTEYVTGFESRADTGEPSAPAERQPENMQSVTWCFAFDYIEGEDHTIDKPADYDAWRAFQPPYWPGPMLELTAPHPRTLEPITRVLLPHHDEQPGEPPASGSIDLWRYRRILARANFAPGAVPSDIVLVNWPMVDYVSGPLFDAGGNLAEHFEGAKQMSLCFLYWMQTEMPTPDGGKGLPGLRLRGDVFGTEHGLAKYPYIRESRRIAAEYTIVEQDVAASARPENKAKQFDDSVGVGCYRIDLHPSTGGDNYIDVGSLPFQIPLGALLPVRVRNLLPAAKNLGTTHITNGCYRLHPVEWNIGEAAGLLAARCITEGTTPHQVRADQVQLRSFQQALTDDGVELAWPDVAVAI